MATSPIELVVDDAGPQLLTERRAFDGRLELGAKVFRTEYVEREMTKTRNVLRPQKLGEVCDGERRRLVLVERGEEDVEPRELRKIDLEQRAKGAPAQLLGLETEHPQRRERSKVEVRNAYPERLEPREVGRRFGESEASTPRRHNEVLDDVQVSTLRRYAKALGAEVQLVVVLDGRRFVLKG